MLLSGSHLSAHEAGTTRAVAGFAHDGRYTVDIATDAAALLARLQVARREPRTAPASVDAYQRAFDGLCADLAAHIGLSFDGRPVAPALTCTVDRSEPAATGPGASTTDAPLDTNVLGVTITARGDVPPGARTFRWKYDMTLTQYAFAVRTSASSTTEASWLDGGQESDALPVVQLAPPAAPVARWTVLLGLAASGFARVLPGGVVPVLLVWGLCLGRTRRSGARDVAIVGLATTVAIVTWAVSGSAAAWRPALASIAESGAILCVAAVAASNLFDWQGVPARTALLLASGLTVGIGLTGSAAGSASASPSALLAFAAGVDAALAAAAAGAWAIVGRWPAEGGLHRRSIGVPGSAVVAMLAMLLAIERMAAVAR